MNDLFLAIEWNVNPEIVGIGGFSLRWYSLLFATGFILGYTIVKRMFEREQVPLEWLDSLLLYLIIGTILGARLGHCLFYDWDYFSQHPLEIFLPFKFGGEEGFRFTGFQGLASHGGAIGVILMLWLFSRRVSKKPLLWIMDRIAVPTALAGCFIRLGNLMNSEIVGNETDAAFGFIFRQLGEDFARHPVQLYESVSYLLIFFVLMYMYWRTDAGQKLGRLTGFFFVAIFSARFLLEYFKRSQGGLEEAVNNALTTGQILSIPFILVGLFLLLRPTKTIKPTKKMKVKTA